jgi:hypothetical protein
VMDRRSPQHWLAWLLVTLALVGLPGSRPAPVSAQSDLDPSPPQGVVKLIFIHHSSGENWLTDGNGDLGLRLGENNYFVSDTNYGWGPDGIGDRTDILNWPEWFVGPDSPRYLEALYQESGQNSGYTRTLQDPGGENQIVMFKSCFPNSSLEGNPDDPPAPADTLTVGAARQVYNDLLTYFATRPDRLFVVITAPPVADPTYAANARAFNTWLVEDWLDENSYPYHNVFVFDFYNVLTGPDNHHRYRDGAIEYITDQGGDTAYYVEGGDDHPTPEGNQKATEEFIPLLNVAYHRWQAELAGGEAVIEAPATSAAEEVPTGAEEAPAEDVAPAEPAEQGGSAGLCPLSPVLLLAAGAIALGSRQRR